MPYAFAYPDLPILARKDDIVKAVQEHQAVVVQGGTGSGKTTQLPKFLLDADLAWAGLIGVTQPRRIAALSIADRLRQETARPELIGSQIRFHEDMPAGARVKVMTDGILLQEFRRDPLLRRYACIILDEAHERSLNVDILLGIFKNLLPRRSEFRLIVTSATLDADRFAKYLAVAPGPGPAAVAPPAADAAKPPSGTRGSVPVIEVEGRQFPVSLEYWDISGNEAREAGGGEDDNDDVPARAFPPVEAAAIAIRELQARRRDNLLAFLPTEKEIHELHRELEKDLGRDFLILPLYSRLAPGDQKRVFTEGGKPRIILATNIAETSLTIPGIAYVVDTGLARISRYHPQTKIQGLPIEHISKASARQRAGRAGRVKPGTCVRLYSEADFNERAPFTEPEVLRSNLANVVLHLLALGLEVESFPFPDPPAPAALKGAFRQLHELGAVDGPGADARLTPEGRKLSKLPVDVAIGKILLKAGDYNVLQPALIIAAGITVQDARFLPREEPERQKAAALHKRFEDPRSDFLGVLALWAWIHRNWGDRFTQRKLRALCAENFLSYNRVREWMDLADQFARLLKLNPDPAGLKLEEVLTDSLHKSILAGFLPFLGRRKPEDVSYRLAGDKEAFIHPGSSLAKRRPEWIVAGEVRQTSRVFIYRAAEIKPAWVEEIAPEACKRTYANVAWNPERGFVEAVERVSFKGFSLRQDRRVDYEGVAPEDCAEIFWREGVIRDGAGAPFPFRAANQKVLESLASLENKARQRGLVPDEEALAHWYRTRAPGVASRIGLERFLKEAGRDKLAFGLKDWLGRSDGDGWKDWLPDDGRAAIPSEPPAVSDPALGADVHPLHRLFPDSFRNAGVTYPVSYRFDYGDALDGISLETDPDGLAALSLRALCDGLPGWRKWIWDYALERMHAKAAQSAQPREPEIARAWASRRAPDQGPDGPAADTASNGQGVRSPAAELASLLAAQEETAAINFPSTWPSHLQIHIFVRSSNGRKFLLHVDPACGEAGFFAARRRMLYGDPSRPWGDWLRTCQTEFAAVPAPLEWRGLGFGPNPLQGRAETAEGGSAAAFFPTPEEASFHHALARAQSDPLDPPADAKASAALSAFFSKRLQALFDAWGCPERPRQETAVLREHASYVLLPSLYLRAFGPNALARAEKDLPPPRPAPTVKPGTQVKSLAALGQAAASRGDSGAWAGAALCLGAALVSLEQFTAWFRCFAQPPLEAKAAFQALLRKACELPDWESLLLSPYHAALASQALLPFLPAPDAKPTLEAGKPRHVPMPGPRARETVHESSSPSSPIMGQPTLADVAAAWEQARACAEGFRKGSKSRRDRFCARIAALGQSVAGLPKETRAALDALDKPVSWRRKAEAELELDLYLEKQAVKAAGAEAKPDTASQERQDKQRKDLGARFRKL